MAQDKSILEEAIIQMKNLEEAVAENAKGILGSVMSKEIKELVKESLTEAEEEDDEEIEDMDDEDMEDEDMEDEMEFDMDDEDMEDEIEFDMDDEDMSEPDMDSPETIDLTNAPSSEVLKVFKLLSPEDEIVVTKDSNDNIHFQHGDDEFLIMNEGDDEELEEMWEMKDEDEEEVEETIYEVEMEEEEEKEMYGMDEMYDMDDMDDMDGIEETIYEVEMDEDFVTEAKKSFKAKGMVGKGPKFDYGKVMDYKTKKMPQGSKMPKDSGKDVGYEFDMKSPSLKGEFGESKHMTKSHSKMEKKEGMMKKSETKEASRTYGMGSKSGRGLRKGITPNRNLTFESTENAEVEILREKNEEYRKALNVFRNKLNEVAVFNSNLAYATRLFTEHSTSKNEKINILKRFDGVETLKESKNLYKTIKDELTSSKGTQISESMERTIEKAPSTGSAISLIESKTYENPQFMRMKDLMSKLK